MATHSSILAWRIPWTEGAGELHTLRCVHRVRKSQTTVKRLSTHAKHLLHFTAHKRMLGSLVIAAAKSLQSCLTLCDPVDGSPPGSPVPGILRQEQWSGLPFPSPMHESEK